MLNDPRAGLRTVTTSDPCTLDPVGSLAVTVTVVRPACIGVTVIRPLSTATDATAGFPGTAAKVREFPSGSLKYSETLNQLASPPART